MSVPPGRWEQLKALHRPRNLSPAGSVTRDQLQASALAGLAEFGADVEDPATLVAMDTALACAQALMVQFPVLHPGEAVGMVRQFLAERACLLPDPPSA